MLTATECRQSGGQKEQNLFLFGPDELDIKVQIPKDLVWETVQTWVDKNTKLFVKIANPFKNFLPAGTNIEDLKSIAYIAAFETIEKASTKDRLDDFVPFFCRIFRTEIIKQAKGVPVVSMIDLPVHEMEGGFCDTAIAHIRFENETDTFDVEAEIVVKSFDLLTSSQKQFVKVVFDNSTCSVAQLAKKLDILPASVWNRVGVITKRIHLKQANHKSTRTRKYYMVKPVSDQRDVDVKMKDIFIDNSCLKPIQIRNYFIGCPVSDQRIVRPDTVLNLVDFETVSFSKMKCPVVQKNVRKGDTFLTAWQKETPPRLLVSDTETRAKKNKFPDKHLAPPGWFFHGSMPPTHRRFSTHAGGPGGISGRQIFSNVEDFCQRKIDIGLRKIRSENIRLDRCE